ncbi:GGDEF domain-containing protein [Patulibacter minatonensis]|uniref:GGDEF domain-containing protein n=1 Tax=Patulibacter minatonensis TaxID=298163 RepID=UPI00047DE717|nr:GGDEF domain-containing protein [Patulibacter minatonensis]
MSFSSSVTANLRRVPTSREPTAGLGRHAIVAHVDRWYTRPRGTADARAVLVVLDVDLDDALPRDEAEELERRSRLGRTVERALSARIRHGDAVARIDAGRFAILRAGRLSDEHTAAFESRELAHAVEEALVGRPEGFGVRVTVGATTLVGDDARAGQEALGSVTAAMLEGKLLTDDRVVVVVAPRG